MELRTANIATATASIFEAAVDPATYTPAATEIIAQTVNTYDTVNGNLLTAKRVKDFSAQTGPTRTFNYDANKLNVLSFTRNGDINGDGVSSETSPSMVYDAYGRPTTGLTAGWYVTQTEYDDVGRVKRMSTIGAT